MAKLHEFRAANAISTGTTTPTEDFIGTDLEHVLDYDDTTAWKCIFAFNLDQIGRAHV